MYGFVYKYEKWTCSDYAFDEKEKRYKWVICIGDIVKYRGQKGIVIKDDNDTEVTVHFDNGLLDIIYRRNLIK